MDKRRQICPQLDEVIVSQVRGQPGEADVVHTGLSASGGGNFFRRLALPEAIKHWFLTSVQTRLIKTGGRLVRHARRLVFQLAEVMVSRDMFGEMLERIGRLRRVPG